VPFSSLQEKNMNQNRTTSAITPGPGAYLGTKTVDRSGKKDYGLDHAGVGQIALKSRSNRMGPTAPGSSVYTTSTIEKNPGPGTYPKAIHQDLVSQPQKDLLAAARPVVEVTDKTTPSIPRMKLLPGQAPEMEDSDVANFVMRHTGDRGDTAGPGEYDNGGGWDIVARTQPHTTFHMSKLSRNLWEPSVDIQNKLPPRENPGPGSYAISAHREWGARLEEEEANTYQFSSRSALPHQTEPAAERIIPGPGQYDLTALIDKGAQTARERSAVRGELTQFGSVSERTNLLLRSQQQPYKDPYNLRNVPGPGHYPDISSFPIEPRKKEAEKVLTDARKKKIHGVHHPTIVMALAETQGPLQAFNSTDDRACNKAVDQRTPAPWQYNRDTARGSSMNAELREKAKVGRRGAFGSCADRFYGSPLAGKLGLPDPSSDGFEGMSGSVGANSEPRSAFQSTANRFHSAPGPREEQATKVGNTDTPGPGAFDVDREPNYRSPFRQPRNEHLSFGSAKTRFDPGKISEDVFYGHMTGLPNPGPGDYNPPSARRQRPGGAAKVKANRPPNLVGCTTDTVGPGSYGNVETHMLKKTFNVSTQAPVNANGSEMAASSSVRS